MPPRAPHRLLLLLLLALGCVVQGPPPVVRVAPGAPPLPPLAPAAPTSSTSTARVVDLRYGGSFCALREDGRVACWGYDDSSSLGDGTIEARSQPALVPGLDRVQRLLGMPPLGFCALLADASLWCWGFAHIGDVSVPTAGVEPRPIAEHVRDFGFAESWPGVCVQHDSGATSCTEFRTERGPGCAYWADTARSSCVFPQNRVVLQSRPLAEAGRVRFGQDPVPFHENETCWAAQGQVLCQAHNNFGGKLGDPSLRRAETPTKVPGLRDIISVSDSGTATCAVRADGIALCWGENGRHELIVPPDPQLCPAFYPPQGQPCNSRPTPLPINDVAQVVLTQDVVVVLTRSGAVLRSRALANAAAADAPPFELVAGIPPATKLVRAVRHPAATCALTRSGDVYCFGRGAHLGDGTPFASHVPVPIPGVQGAVEVQANLVSACARLADGSVRCWGDPEAPRGLRDIVGLGSPCALASDGRVWCWGTNSYGEMGLGRRERPGLAHDMEIQHVPLPVPGLRGISAISSTNGTTCALDRAGAVRCWGVWGPKFPTLSPTLIPNLPPAIEIWSAEESQCALSRAGEVWCWSTGKSAARHPELGAVGHLPSHGPGSFPERQACVVDKDRAVRCDGTPSRLPTLGSVSQISTGRDPRAGISRGCAVLESGALVCWGPDYCADGATVCVAGAWNDPHQVLDGVKQVSVGTYLACAVRTDGSVWCWGRGDEGGLGNEAPTLPRLTKVDLVHLAR